MPHAPDSNAHRAPSHATRERTGRATVDGGGPVESSIFEHLPDVVLRLDRDGRILFANEAIRGVAGRPPEHYIGRLVRDVVALPDVARRFAAAQEAAVADGRPITFEVQLDGADGPRWFEYRMSPERGAGGAVETVLAIGREVTAARRAMEVVCASEARYRALVEATSQVVWTAGPIGQLGGALDGWLTYTGQVGDPARRGSGDEWLEVVHPDDRATAWAAWTAALRARGVYEARYRLRRRDGVWRTVVARAAPVCGADGRIVEWIGTLTDVTERADLERTLRETERRLATLVSNLPGVAYRVIDDQEWTAEFVSDGVVPLTGYTADDLTSGRRSFASLIHADDLPWVRAAVRAALDAGRPFELTYRIVRADGAVRRVWEQGRGVSPATPGPRFIEGLIVDVTEREEARAALEAERARLAEAHRIAHLSAWTWDRATGETCVSAEWWRILGVDPRAEPDARAALRRLLAPEDRARMDRELADVDRHRLPRTESRYRLVRPDGGERVVHVCSVWRFDAAGARVGGSGTVQDVTAQVKAEAEIARQRALLEESQRLAHVGSWELDLATDTLTWSDEMYRIVGLPPSAGPMTRDAGIAMIPAEDRAYVRAAFAEASAAGNDAACEHGLYRADGTVVTVVTRVGRRPGAAGAAGRIVGATQDVSERRQLEEQFRQTQKMEALGLLAGSVAHDFNNLLTAILGGAEMARREVPQGSTAAADLDDVRHAAVRASALTRQLLTFSRKQPHRPRVLDLREVVRRSEGLLRRLLPESVVLDVVAAGQPCVTRADASQIEQILVNLVVNARDAIAAGEAPPEGGAGDATPGVVTVDVGLRTLASGHRTTAGGPLPAGAYATLAVRDTGVGMAPSTLGRIFEPFFTTKPEGRGTGLGLATVFGIVGQNGGAIDVESAPGAGSTFTVYLPAVPGPAEDVVAGAAATPRGGTETVLLVEDERAVREMATRVLERHGYRVIAARHGADALLAWREQADRIDVAVTDLRMPAMGGRALVEQLRAERPDLALVVMSGYAGDDADDGDDLERTSRREEIFLEKPFTAESLLRHVRAALDRATDRARGDAGRRSA